MSESLFDDSSDSSEWSCENCTYVNSANSLSCEMCYTVRTSIKDLPVTWSWAPNEDQWIPYDAPTTEEIEQAYQQGKKVSF